MDFFKKFKSLMLSSAEKETQEIRKRKAPADTSSDTDEDEFKERFLDAYTKELVQKMQKDIRYIGQSQVTPNLPIWGEMVKFLEYGREHVKKQLKESDTDAMKRELDKVYTGIWQLYDEWYRQARKQEREQRKKETQQREQEREPEIEFSDPAVPDHENGEPEIEL